jgi:CBS domain-containing protein
LNEHNILSAPVMDAKFPDLGPNCTRPVTERCIGMVDVIDLVTAMLDASRASMEREAERLAKEAVEEKAVEEGESATFKEIHFADIPMHIRELPVAQITGLQDQCQLRPFEPLTEENTLLDAIQQLAGSKVRRVPVVSADGLRLTNILSQSKVVQIMAGLNLPAVAEKTLMESGLADPLPVLSVRGEDPIGKAFEIIKEQHISGVPVVGINGAIIGNVSARDVYGLMFASGKLHLLKMPTRRFLQRLTGPQTDIRSLAVCCTGRDTLRDVMARMSAAKVHRIFLTDASDRLSRVISLGDIVLRLGVEALWDTVRVES